MPRSNHLKDGWVAATRFGLGPRPGEVAAAARDPRGWLEAQLVDSNDDRLFESLSSSGELILSSQAMRTEMGTQESRKAMRRQAKKGFAAESHARMRQGIVTQQPFRERLVRFFSNHFTVSVARDSVMGLAGPFEREAIRPHVLGSFKDLLIAVVRHPAMLYYLDNVRSTGTDSRTGQRRGRGLNENLAREVLELHSLGVNGGYTQDDVEALANILTGWSVADRQAAQQRDISQDPFSFSARRHQPGTKTLLGKRYSGGESEGLQALSDLADHPSTARFIATKLARHFVSDDPSERVIASLTDTYTRTGGSLKALARALIRSDDTWRGPTETPKLRTPQELITATCRACGLNARRREEVWETQVLKAYHEQGQGFFSAPSPAGWPDRASDWAGPDQVLKRVDWAEAVGSHARDRVPDPVGWADDILGPRMSRQTRDAIAQAPDRSQAIAFTIACPEFQWR